MENIREALWNDYNSVSKLIQTMDTESNNYKELLAERNNIRNDILKIEQIKNDNNIKNIEIQSEEKRDKYRNIITLITFSGSFLLSLYGLHSTFEFDRDSTVTSTLGKRILSKFTDLAIKK